MTFRNALLATAAATTLTTFAALPVPAQEAAPPLVNSQVNTVEHPFRPKNGGGSFTANPTFNYNRPAKHLLYVATPGGSANGMLRLNGSGLVVLDADNKYNFVKRISWNTPASLGNGPEVAGITANVPLNMLYVELRSRLLAFDLATDKLVWEKSYGGNILPANHESGTPECCERGELTPDGKTLVVGSNLYTFWYVIDAKTGEEKGRIYPEKTQHAHNMALSPDGKRAFLAASAGKPPVVSVADVETRKIVQTIEFSDIVRPMVINHDGSRVYADIDNLLGFEIGDVKTGKMIQRVEAPAEMWKAKWADPNLKFFGHGAPSHGIALTPDESEVWLVDNINYGVLVWDNTGPKPVFNPQKSFKTTYSSGWITMGLDGKLAYLGSGDVVDVKEHKVITQLKDEYGRPLASEKQLELAFQDGKLVQATSQFGQGRPEAVAARTGMKRASN